ncbi:MAG: hypothetical protein IJ415_00565 [Clostridia bacterium]|nr:hypothetical protein [Clostridia bacterium]
MGNIKKIKKMSNEEILAKLDKIDNNITIIRSLLFISLGLSVSFGLYIPLAFLLGSMAVVKACLVVAVLLSLGMPGFFLAGFVLDKHECKLQAEKKLREQIASKTKEYHNENSKLTQKAEYKNKSITKDYSKDDDMTKGL